MAKGQRAARWVTPQDRRMILRMAAAGASQREIGAALDRGRSTVQLVLGPVGGVFRREALREQPGRGLSLEQRVQIQLGLREGLSFAAVGAQIGRHRTTVWREVTGNSGRDGYEAIAAHRRAARLARRPKPTKLQASAALVEQVEAGLVKWWSPQEIAGDLRRRFGDDESMTVSHETIYKALFVQGRGELRRELTRCLRTGKARRTPRGQTAGGYGPIPGMVSISERPAEVADRAVPGHWEGDLILGRGNASAVGTLVERSTRFVMLLHLGRDKSADAVCAAMTAKILTLPAALRQTLTWDQGREMARHARFSVDTDVQVFFCDPHSPWQRGSNENTNGLLRQYLPKGTDLSVHTPADLDAIAASLNGRPRMTLDWANPTEKMNELLLH